MNLMQLDEIVVMVESVKNIKKTLDADKVKDNLAVDQYRVLSAKYHSLLGTISECLLSAANLVRTYDNASKMRQAIVRSDVRLSSAASKNQAADDDLEYIKMSDEKAKATLYYDYVDRLYSEVNSSHYLMKNTYDRKIDLFLSTPRTNI